MRRATLPRPVHSEEGGLRAAVAGVEWTQLRWYLWVGAVWAALGRGWSWHWIISFTSHHPPSLLRILWPDHSHRQHYYASLCFISSIVVPPRQYELSGEVIANCRSISSPPRLSSTVQQNSGISGLAISSIIQTDHSALVSLHNIWLNMRTCHVLNVLKIIISIKTV